MLFETLYNRYWKKIFRLCLAYVNDYEQAKDLAQEAFIIVWQQLPNFRNESDILTWIFRIASNNCLRNVTKEKKVLRAELPIDLKVEYQESLETNIQLLYKFISELPETERIIISLELEEIQQAEIAHIVGLSEVNVRVKIHRIKEKLMKKFKENEQ